jgi:Cu(I)/Ag(I) efflux system membrane protein CusA/SilA
MPVTMPHASIGEAMDVIRKQDMAIQAIPEVESVVGKIGRVESPLDPAPVSMVETVINYKPEYILDKSGHRMRFRYDHENKEFARDGDGDLIPDAGGIPYRQWRSEIRDADDIWDEIASAAILPGTTTASKLQPIKTRIIMLQTGMRSTFGIKVYGPDLETIEGVPIESSASPTWRSTSIGTRSPATAFTSATYRM